MSIPNFDGLPGMADASAQWSAPQPRHPHEWAWFRLLSPKDQADVMETYWSYNREMTAADLGLPPACTCHPDDQPPECQRLYAAGDCIRAYRALVPPYSFWLGADAA